MPEKVTYDQLRSHLWESTNILRGSIDSSDYKNYIFGMLFLKRLSDCFEERCEEIRGSSGEDFVEDRDFHDFYVPERARWNTISNVAQDIGAAINKAFEVLEEENRTLEGVLVSIDYNDKERLPDNVLEELIQHFSEIDLRKGNLEDPDILGRAYEYLINQFADDAGKKGGEFYTPRQVVKLLVGVAPANPENRTLRF